MNSFNFSCDDGDLDRDLSATSLEYPDDQFAMLNLYYPIKLVKC